MGVLKSVWFKIILPHFFFVFFFLISVLYSILFIWRLIFIAVVTPSKLKSKPRALPPKCLNDPNFGAHKYVQLKNIKLHYVEAGNKQKPLAIFLHGFPDFWYTWRHQIKEFSQDFRTVAVDLRGYGDSEKPGGRENYKFTYVTEDIKNLIESFDCKKCILIGHDWGGVITWKFARQYPEKLEKYVIINAPDEKVFWKYVTSSFDQFLKSWYIFFFQSPYIPEKVLSLNDMEIFKKVYVAYHGKSLLTEEDLEAYKFTFGKADAFTPPLNYYRFLLTRNQITKVPSYNNKEPISIPGLMIISDSDGALAMDMLEKSAKSAGGESMKSKIVANAAHFVHQERPEEVNAALSEFIRG